MSSKRRNFEPKFKLKCVLDVLNGSVASLAIILDIYIRMIRGWSLRLDMSEALTQESLLTIYARRIAIMKIKIRDAHVIHLRVPIENLIKT